MISGGDRGEGIFQDDVVRQGFLKTPAEACRRMGFEVYAYCLMRNHFHLVVATPNPNVVAGMQWQGKPTETVRPKRPCYSLTPATYDFPGVEVRSVQTGLDGWTRLSISTSVLAKLCWQTHLSFASGAHTVGP